jgi:hypothetical protein
MIGTELAGIVPPASSALVERESRLQRLVAIYIVTGVLFMLLPGTLRSSDGWARSSSESDSIDDSERCALAAAGRIERSLVLGRERV